MCIPATPCWPYAASTASTAFVMISGVVVTSVGSQEPVPPLRCAAAIAASASGVASLLNSTPPPPLTCTSTNAGQAMHSLSQQGPGAAPGAALSTTAVTRPESMRNAAALRNRTPSKSCAGRSHQGPAAGGWQAFPGADAG